MPANRQPWSYAFLLVLILGAAWIWISRLPGGNPESGVIPAPQKGFSAPDFTLQTLAGQTVTLSNLRGRAVVINFWASWCPPCRAEMPALQRAYRDYAGQEVEILAINTSNQDDENQARIFVGARGLAFPIPLDMEGKVARLYQLSALPTTFFIDARGIIQEVVVGGPLAEALLRVRIEQLLEGEGQP